MRRRAHVDPVLPGLTPPRPSFWRELRYACLRVHGAWAAARTRARHVTRLRAIVLPRHDGTRVLVREGNWVTWTAPGGLGFLGPVMMRVTRLGAHEDELVGYAGLYVPPDPTLRAKAEVMRQIMRAVAPIASVAPWSLWKTRPAPADGLAGKGGSVVFTGRGLVDGVWHGDVVVLPPPPLRMRLAAWISARRDAARRWWWAVVTSYCAERYDWWR